MLLGGEVVEEGDYAIGFGALAGVLLDGVDQAAIRWRGTAIVEEEDALAYAPEGGGAEFVAGGGALGDVVGQALAHVVNEEIGIESCGLIAESGRECGVGSLQRRGVAHDAADGGEDDFAIGQRLRRRIIGNAGGRGRGRREEAGEHGEGDYVTGDLRAGEIEIGLVFGSGIVEARGGRIAAFGLEQFVGDAHLDVVGFAGEISRDLFWAFQPKRVMEPSLPLRLGWPEIPRADLAAGFAAMLARMVASAMFSMSPAPKVGVGMRKIKLFWRAMES